jgi:iron complex transport system substrate-binding protein
VLLWDPDVIITIDRDLRLAYAARRLGAGEGGARRPRAPRQSCRSAGSIFRLREPADRLAVAGENSVPRSVPEDMRALTRDFYARFYHVTPSDQQIDRVLAGQD